PKFNVIKKLTPDLIIEGQNLVKRVYKSLNKPLPELGNILHSNTSGVEALRALKNLCEAVLPESNSKGYGNIEPDWKYWKVLWLDDEENKESPLYRELVKRLGSEDKVIMCESYEEAVQYWEADKAYGEISLVICDYRLKNKDGFPTSKQGYDFMKYLANDGRSVGKIAYSGLKRKFLIESFRHYGIQINIYSKIDFNQHNADDLAFLSDEIIRLGDSHWLEINNAPQASEWVTIAPTKKKKKNGFSFYSFQNHVSRLFKHNLEVFIDTFNKESSKEDLWNMIFDDDFSVRTGSFPSGDDAKTGAIKEILIARRFAIGLYAFLKSERNKQDSLLNKENYLDFIKVVLYNSSLNGKGYAVDDLSDPKVFTKIKRHSTLKLIPKFNALTFDSTWPLGLLPEEFGWLKFDMGLVKETYEEIYKYLEQIQIIKKAFGRLFNEEYFNNLISKEDETMKVSGGKIFFNDENVPLIRNTADAKKLVQSVYRSLDIDNFEAHFHFVSFWRGLVRQFGWKSFRENGILSDFLYFITKTLKATKYKFGTITNKVIDTHLEHDFDSLKQLSEMLITVSTTLKSKSNESTTINSNSLKSLEQYITLSPYSKAFFRNVLKAMLDPSQNREVTDYLKESLEKVKFDSIPTDAVKDYIAVIKTRPSFFPDIVYSVEQEFIIKHRPWEISYPRHSRLESNFQEISDKLLEAIIQEDLPYTQDYLEGRNKIFNLENHKSIFYDALNDFRCIYHSGKSNAYIDIYLKAIAYTKSRADFYYEQNLTASGNRARKVEEGLTMMEYAENKLAQKSHQEQIDYYNDLLDQDESLRIDEEYELYADFNGYEGDDSW
ncbi:MAG: hypothetical protein KDD50_13760, partial [Bdellovibrionales bacterium]|nr:hypothetical protein [Bdellovibrionales bacterium]